MRGGSGSAVRRGLLFSLLLVLLLCVLLPVYLMVRIAFADPGSYLNEGRFVFSAGNLVSVFTSGNIQGPLRKSLTVAFAVSLLSVLIAAPGAYAFARLPGKAGYVCVILIFFTRMVPEVGVALPITVNFIRLGLFDTDAGLVLAHLVRALPLVTWILIGSFKAIPRDLEEAAYIDGCSRFQAFLRVSLPLAKPGIVVGLIFGFLNSWDEFTYATYLTMQHKTLPLTVYYYVERGGWFLSSTYALVVTIPVLLFTYYFQKHLQSGFLAGAVKG
jgi:trehalose transport system permease protein